MAKVTQTTERLPGVVSVPASMHPFATGLEPTAPPRLSFQWPDQWRGIHSLCGAGSAPHPRAGRRGDPRQPRQPQGPGASPSERPECMILQLPYSPDLNPIGHVVAKAKHLMREAATRTRDAVMQTIGQILDRFTPTECANSPATGERPPETSQLDQGKRARQNGGADQARFKHQKFNQFIGGADAGKHTALNDGNVSAGIARARQARPPCCRAASVRVGHRSAGADQVAARSRQQAA